jgi:hypothetical protein
MSRLPTRAIVLVLALLLAACGYNAKQSPLDEMLYSYAGTLRWSDFDRTPGYLDPLSLEVDPLDPLELERLKQYQVTGYDVRTANHVSDVEYEQIVEIRFVNKHTMAEKSIIDRQVWRWDPVAKRWWLSSGLPKLRAD